MLVVSHKAVKKLEAKLGIRLAWVRKVFCPVGARGPASPPGFHPVAWEPDAPGLLKPTYGLWEADLDDHYRATALLGPASWPQGAVPWPPYSHSHRRHEGRG
ncbi:hypothetical protein Adeg_1998 [Ammonifex degensii KC4]|uniref:Uncharacterized protein n=1 Tax=Ammonifex degensii (strain DSM 10501 / KC4) TaxID=429009 RepID=C9R7L5_AMMDK|nr:hypothetical protein [Ammonifex degensii]ACX52294.1 hypothetical protein Adeg_1181 [Ammonifex degensii KC4]ACX53076.1 hypothetical protein Adeg_1998 [Ammonifex degensii KC4]